MVATNASGEALYCPVAAKWDGRNQYSAEDLVAGQYSVRILEAGNQATISRCSFSPSRQIVDCDDYAADRVEVDPHNGIRKYYYFRGQFDVQLFPTGKFVENNGRGAFAIGICQKVDQS